MARADLPKVAETGDAVAPLVKPRESAKLVWNSKPKREPNPRDLEFQPAEVVFPNKAAPGSQLLVPRTPEGEVDDSKLNRLIWGDNLLTMQALLAQGFEGKVDLIYIDPPFLTSEDYTFHIELPGYGGVVKLPSLIERLAYRDTWDGGIDSYLDMLYPRLQLMRRLLSDKGSLFVHIGAGVSHWVRGLLEEVFGAQNFRNEIVLPGRAVKNLQQQFDEISRLQVRHDILYWVTKSASTRFKPYWIEKHDAGNPEGHWHHAWSNADRPTMRYPLLGRTPKSGQWVWAEERALQAVANYERFIKEAGGRTLANYWRDTGCKLEFIRPDPDDGKPQYWRAPAETRIADTVWSGIPIYSPSQGFPTEKNERFLEEVLRLASNKGDLVADFFVGSGTTVAVAEKMNRRWIAADFSKVAVQVTRSRLVEQQSSPFVIENIGNYQRELIYKEGANIALMQRIVLKLYGAVPHPSSSDLGTVEEKDGRVLVYAGYPDRPLTAKKTAELVRVARTLDGEGYDKLVLLAWDYEYNYDELLEIRKKGFGVRVDPRLIPPSIYEYLRKSRDEDDLVEKFASKIQFGSKPYLKIGTPKTSDMGKGETGVVLGLERYVLSEVPVEDEEDRKELQAVSRGDKFAVLIDYWAVDWDYDGKTFRSRWQDFRGNGKRAKVVTTRANTTLVSGRKYDIAVRVVDVFGNDATATTSIDLR